MIAPRGDLTTIVLLNGILLNQLLISCQHIHSLIHVLALIRKKFYVQYALGLLFLL